MKFQRIFAMPNADTLSMPEVGSWARSWIQGESVDPFARNCRLAKWRNDLNPETAAEFHMDAVAFLEELRARGVEADSAIFDPPYSPRQISEVYASMGLTATGRDTQNSRLYRECRDALDAIMKPGGVVLSFGWNSNGMGVKRGYAVEDVLLVQHGGAHNDTICMAERKTPQAQGALALPETHSRQDRDIARTLA